MIPWKHQQELKQRDSVIIVIFRLGQNYQLIFQWCHDDIIVQLFTVTLELLATGAHTTTTTTTKATAGTNVNSSEIDTCRQLIEQEKQRWESLHNSQNQQQPHQQYQKQQSFTSKHSSPATYHNDQLLHIQQNPVNPTYKRCINLTQSLDDTVSALPI
jgi:hypothetical protein